MTKIAPVVALQGGSFYSYSQIELTSGVSAFTPPVAEMFLSFVHVGGGAGAGGLAWIYASPKHGNLHVASVPRWCGRRDLPQLAAGLLPGKQPDQRHQHSQHDLRREGNHVPGDPYLPNHSGSGIPGYLSYRGIYVSAAPTTVTSTAVTITYDAQPGVARAILTWGIGTVGTATAGDNSAYWSYSAGGSYTQFVPCGLQKIWRKSFRCNPYRGEYIHDHAGNGYPDGCVDLHRSGDHLLLRHKA